ncbi:MAG: nodulation S family protein [Actinomycetota bacterium]|nr:nodulation S family protein [Actinomycetota bacterium]
MTSIPIERFEARYARDPDPWGFSSRWYEARKYALTLAALPRRRYRRGFEPGCSIGVLTAGLADRCDYLLAADGADTALGQARSRLAGLAQVEIAKLLLPQEWPEGPWDLVVLSEVAYYFDPRDLGLLLDRAAETTVTGATLIAVHWRGETDYPLTGDAVHEAIGAHGAFENRGGYCETLFRLDVFERRE